MARNFGSSSRGRGSTQASRGRGGSFRGNRSMSNDRGGSFRGNRSMSSDRGGSSNRGGGFFKRGAPANRSRGGGGDMSRGNKRQNDSWDDTGDFSASKYRGNKAGQTPNRGRGGPPAKRGRGSQQETQASVNANPKSMFGDSSSDEEIMDHSSAEPSVVKQTATPAPSQPKNIAKFEDSDEDSQSDGENDGMGAFNMGDDGLEDYSGESDLSGLSGLSDLDDEELDRLIKEAKMSGVDSDYSSDDEAGAELDNLPKGGVTIEEIDSDDSGLDGPPLETSSKKPHSIDKADGQQPKVSGITVSTQVRFTDKDAQRLLFESKSSAFLVHSLEKSLDHEGRSGVAVDIPSKWIAGVQSLLKSCPKWESAEKVGLEVARFLHKIGLIATQDAPAEGQSVSEDVSAQAQGTNKKKAGGKKQPAKASISPSDKMDTSDQGQSASKEKAVGKKQSPKKSVDSSVKLDGKKDAPVQNNNSSEVKAAEKVNVPAQGQGASKKKKKRKNKPQKA